jgi:hypothetical protein
VIKQARSKAVISSIPVTAIIWEPGSRAVINL